MTYREKYQQLHPEEDVTDIHLECCPNARMHDLPDFCCPALPGVEGPDPCRDCWDGEIPGAEAAFRRRFWPEDEPAPTPEKAADGKPTARILVEAIGDTIHMEADGDMEDLVLSVLAAMHGEAKDVFDSAESKLAAEKLICGFDRVLNPLSRIRSFDDKETD